MDNICQYCNKEFSTISNLRAHIKCNLVKFNQI